MADIKITHIVYITVNRPQRMNTSSIWRGRKRNAREREVGNVRQTWAEFIKG